MKSTVLIVLVTAFVIHSGVASAAPANGAINDPDLYRHGRFEMVTGGVVSAMSLAVAALGTSATSSRKNVAPNAATTVGAVGLVSGMWLMWRGHKEMDDARRHTSFGVNLLGERALQVRYRW